MGFVQLDSMMLAGRSFYRLARSSKKKMLATLEVLVSSMAANICVSQAPILSLGTVTGTDGGSRLPWLWDGQVDTLKLS